MNPISARNHQRSSGNRTGVQNTSRVVAEMNSSSRHGCPQLSEICRRRGESARRIVPADRLLFGFLTFGWHAHLDVTVECRTFLNRYFWSDDVAFNIGASQHGNTDGGV